MPNNSKYGERIAKLEQQHLDHEKVCAQRYADIKAAQAANTELLRELNTKMNVGIGAAKIFKWLMAVGLLIASAVAYLKGLK